MFFSSSQVLRNKGYPGNSTVCTTPFKQTGFSGKPEYLQELDRYLTGPYLPASQTKRTREFLIQFY